MITLITRILVALRWWKATWNGIITRSPGMDGEPQFAAPVREWATWPIAQRHLFEVGDLPKPQMVIQWNYTNCWWTNPIWKNMQPSKLQSISPRNLGLSPLKNNLSCHWPRKKEHLAICNAFWIFSLHLQFFSTRPTCMIKIASARPGDL